MEAGEDPYDTVIRETWEETGLHLDRSRLRLIGEQAKKGHVKYFFIATIDSFDGLVKRSKEREITGIFKLEELKKMVDFHPTYRGFYDLAQEASYIPA
jgi:8-oxo-dGTP pyrophosphatase MutT (NUDIX family)